MLDSFLYFGIDLINFFPILGFDTLTPLSEPLDHLGIIKSKSYDCHLSFCLFFHFIFNEQFKLSNLRNGVFLV